MKIESNSILKELMDTNEKLCKRIMLLNQIVAIYKEALTDLKDNSIAKKGLDKARDLTVLSKFKMK